MQSLDNDRRIAFYYQIIDIERRSQDLVPASEQEMSRPHVLRRNGIFDENAPYSGMKVFRCDTVPTGSISNHKQQRVARGKNLWGVQIYLTKIQAEHRELGKRVSSRRGRADDARIARMLLLLADGASYTQVQQTVGCTAPFISKWKRRFLEERLAGLYARHEGRPIQVLTPRMEARILSWTQKKPTDGSTHWSTRRLAKKLGIHHMMVARTWKKHGLQPHRIEHYKASNDPDFETKAADIIGLYMNPPQHAAVFCIDEKTAIQALDRRDPILPLSPGRAERHGFEYVRHGTLSLYAAFDTKTGVVLGKTVRRHTSQEFVAFLEQLVASHKRKREIHVILDNLSAHKTAKVAQFLEANPKVRLHFTPTYSSWLNKIELWFSKIERALIHRGVFTSTHDLTRKIMRYIRKYNEDPKPVKWTYNDPSRRIKTTKRSVVTVH